jgi:Spy/CpxP family protein refolding chaperone
MMRWTMSGMLLIAGLATADAPSPYAREQARTIKALSAADQEALLAGKGMGLARAAELNGYPGPLHVLELAEPLQLSGAQRQQTQALFERMQARAQALGREIVDAERALDAAFAARSIDADALAAGVQRIASLQGELRAAHLAAHLEQARLLTATQRAAYARLRGYAHDEGAEQHHH